MVLLVAGVFAPFLTIRRLIFFENTASIYQMLRALWDGGKFLLFLVVLGFSIMVPTTKLILEGVAWYVPMSHSDIDQLHQWIKRLSQLSMVEIFVAAIMAAVVKFGAWATVEIHAGVYILLGSVLAGLWASIRLKQCLHGAR